MCFIVAMGSGCSSLPFKQVPSDLVTRVQTDFAGAGIDITQKDAAKAIKYAKQISTVLPPQYKDAGAIAVKILEQLTNIITVTDILYTNQIPSGFLAAGFLENNAALRNMNALSINKSENGFDDLLDRSADFGFTELAFGLGNQGDGSPVPTTFYRDNFFGDIDPVKVKMMQARLQRAKDSGFSINLWGILDDSPALARGSDEQLLLF